MSYITPDSDILYLSNLTTSGISGYETLEKPPMTAGSEVELSATIASADGTTLLKAFASPALGVDTLPAGNFVFSFYGAVSQSDGVSQLTGRVYTRNSTGTETFQFTFDSGNIDETTGTPTLHTITYESTDDISVNTTDRLILKVYAKTDYASDITISLFYMGETHQSRMKLPVSLVKVTGGDMLAALYDPDYDGLTSGSGSTSTSEGISTSDVFTFSESNISNPPTELELITAIGSPDLYKNKVIVLNDGGAGNNIYLVISDGSHYMITTMAKPYVATPSMNVDATTTLISTTDMWYGRVTLEQLNSGVWVMVYLEATTHYTNDDVVHIRFSDDQGATWTDEDTYLDSAAVTGFPAYPPGAASSDPEGPGDTYIFEAPNGNLWLHTWKVDYTGNTMDGCWHVKSEDGGKTWAGWSKITWTDIDSSDNNDYAMGTEQHFILDGDIYLAGRIHEDPTEANIKNCLYKSTDYGENWSFVSNMDTYGTNTLECAMEYLGDDHILCYLRATDRQHAYMVESTDMGSTWSVPFEVQGGMGILGRNRLYTRSHLKGYSDWWQDKVLVMCGYTQQTPGSSTDRRNGIWVSLDAGSTWTGPLYVDITAEDGGYGDILYSSSDNQYKFINYYGTQEEAVIKQYDLTITGI